MTRISVAAVLLGIAACAAAKPPVVVREELPVVPHFQTWPVVKTAARLAADSGRFADADRILADYSAAFPGSAFAAESEYQRVLLKADPANKDVKPHEILLALDSYLALPNAEHVPEAQALRRFVVIADSLRAANAAARSAGDARVTARDDELNRLRDELAKTQDELDRIKRRLTGKP
jgi:hypothetical protein